MSKTVLVLAAGLGMRYGGLKQLERFGPKKRTLLEYSLEDASSHGYDRAVCTVLEENISAMEELLKSLRFRMAIELAVQRLDDGPLSVPSERKKPWGTAHAVFAARHLLDTPFVVVNADDYYGTAAWEALATVLTQHPGEPALVAYKLTQTLSPHGPVSRGVCQLFEGRLNAIAEFRRIGLDEDGKVRDAFSGAIFSGAESVSMNFWHLTPSFLNFLRRDGEAFFGNTTGWETAEWALSNAVGRWLQEERGSIWGTIIESPWCGVTHPQDREWVEEFLSRTLTDPVLAL